MEGPTPYFLLLFNLTAPSLHHMSERGWIHLASATRNRGVNEDKRQSRRRVLTNTDT